MQEALRSLNEVSSNVATPKTIKKNITDMVADLTNGQYSISVTTLQHVRVTLWQQYLTH